MRKYIIIVTATILASNAQSTSSRNIEQQIRSTQQAALAHSHQSEVDAGNANSPKIVSPDAIPSLEQIRKKYKALESQLKPEFLKAMIKPQQVASLPNASCRPELTLPVGIEASPGQLNGTTTLFVCDDGSYGNLIIHQKVRQKNIIYDRNGNNNDAIGEVPVLSRHYQAATGMKKTIIGWEGNNNEIATLVLMEDLKQSSIKSLNQAQPKFKTITKALLGLQIKNDGSQAIK